MKKFGWVLGAGLLALTSIGAAVQDRWPSREEAPRSHARGAEEKILSMKLTKLTPCAYDAALKGAMSTATMVGRVRSHTTVRVTSTLFDRSMQELAMGHTDFSATGEVNESVRIVVPISKAQWRQDKVFCLTSWAPVR